MKDIKVYIHQSDTFNYPNAEEYFNPSENYPEYQFAEGISSSENHVYDMIRNCLYELGLDNKNYGTPEWDPLGDIILKGNTILIKPNMVMHVNGIRDNGTECLITHPSVVRPVIDYVVKALKGFGRIIIADAPMQSCDFKRLVVEQGYNRIIEFYQKHNINIELVDLRNYVSHYDNGVLCKYESNSQNESVIVDLKGESEFTELDQRRLRNLRITNYVPSIMYEHHNNEKHEYLIAKQVLEADVIINIPKPKTHRKAGVTVSLKNLVGINTNKEWLPHHTLGSIAENGDEYKNKSLIKRIRTKIFEQIYLHSELGDRNKVKFLKYLVRFFNGVSKLVCKDQYSEGSWYGNDTIWRTILDLNRIVFYADKKGIIQKERQRKMLIIADMIISGEGEGPLLPTPKNVGVLAVGNNPVFFDEIISKIMGFDCKLIPSINNARFSDSSYPLIDDTQNCLVKSNNNNWNLKSVSNLTKDIYWFEPSSGWKNYKSNKQNNT